jgi:hypothetical protein
MCLPLRNTDQPTFFFRDLIIIINREESRDPVKKTWQVVGSLEEEKRKGKIQLSKLGKKKSNGGTWGQMCLINSKKYIFLASKMDSKTRGGKHEDSLGEPPSDPVASAMGGRTTIGDRGTTLAIDSREKNNRTKNEFYLDVSINTIFKSALLIH